jgi:hypothetical protein
MQIYSILSINIFMIYIKIAQDNFNLKLVQIEI